MDTQDDWAGSYARALISTSCEPWCEDHDPHRIATLMRLGYSQGVADGIECPVVLASRAESQRRVRGYRLNRRRWGCEGTWAFRRRVWRAFLVHGPALTAGALMSMGVPETYGTIPGSRAMIDCRRWRRT